MKRSFIGVWLGALAGVLASKVSLGIVDAPAAPASMGSFGTRTRSRMKGKPGKAGDKLKRLAAEGRLGLRH